MMNPLTQPGSIIGETIGEIRSILGSEFEAIAVERAVIGIFFTFRHLHHNLRTLSPW